MRDSHLRNADPCDLHDQSPDRDWGLGFDDEQAAKLKSRERNVPGQEKWKRFYKVLFPHVSGEDIPSPCEKTFA